MIVVLSWDAFAIVIRDGRGLIDIVLNELSNTAQSNRNPSSRQEYEKEDVDESHFY